MTKKAVFKFTDGSLYFTRTETTYPRNITVTSTSTRRLLKLW